MIIPQFSHRITPEFSSIWNSIFHNPITQRKDTFVIYLVVLLDKRPISCCEIVELDPENYLIDSIGVCRELRGKQIAQYTLRFAETKIREIGGFNAIVRIVPDYEYHYVRLGYREHLGGEILVENDVQKIEMKRALKTKRNRE